MTLEFSLSPDAESRLRDRARASGLTPDAYARRIVEEAVLAPVNSTNGPAAPDAKPPSTAEERLALLREWTGSITSPGPVDDSRESMYSGEGRGE